MTNTVADKIYDNLMFNIPTPDGTVALVNMGIYGDNNQFSDIYQNEFLGLNHVNVRGLVQRNCREAPTSIYKNTFDNFLYSSQLEQDNSALSLRCNEYTSVQGSAWNVIDNGDGVLGNQGFAGINTTKADNQFFDVCGGDPFSTDPDIRSEVSFTYYDKTGNLNPAESECVSDPEVTLITVFDESSVNDCQARNPVCSECDIAQVRQAYETSVKSYENLGEYLRTALDRYDKSYAQNYGLPEIDDAESVLLARSDDLSYSLLSSLYSNRGQTSSAAAKRNQIVSTDYHYSDYKQINSFLETIPIEPITDAVSDSITFVGQNSIDNRSSADERLLARDMLVTGRFTPLAFLPNGQNAAPIVNRAEDERGSSNVGLILYPNPTSGNVHIELPLNTHVLNVYLSDIYGHVIKRYNPTDISKAHDMSQVTPGSYYLTVETEEDVYTSLLIIQ